MRVLRTILGLLLLIIGLPALLVGAGFWAAMQHRDPGGAFSGDLQRTVTSGYAVVVPDADGLLRRDAPFARAGSTRLRLTAYTLDGPAFIGIGPADQVARYLDDVPRQVVKTVDLGTGALPVATSRVAGTRAPAALPDREPFWLKSATGGLDWHPSALRGRHYSLVIMSPGAQPGLEVTATAQLSPGWLNSATWALLILGSLLVMAGIVVLAWPGRRREVVYVVEPSQVPDLMVAIGAPLPLSRTGGGRHAGTHRPRTLADAGTKSAQSALPPLAWPPSQSDRGIAPVSPVIATSPPQVAGGSPAVPAGGSAAVPAGGSTAVPPSAAAYAAATAIPGPARGTGQRMPAPGEPLSLIGGVSGAPHAAPSSASRAAATEVADNRPTEPIGRRRAMVPATDTPVFEATAVGAWVAETAAARARETEARAAAVLAAEAAKREAAKGEATKPEAAEPAKKEPVASRPVRGAHAAPDATPAPETAASTASGADEGGPAGPSAQGAHSEGWSATGLRRADSPVLGTPASSGPDASPPAANVTKTPVAAPVEPAKAQPKAPDDKAAAEKAATPTKGDATASTKGDATASTKGDATASTKDDATAPSKGDATPPVPAKAAAVAVGSATSGRDDSTMDKPAPQPAEAAQSKDPESTAPAPARPTAPNRPTIPAPARPAPPPRPTPDPTPSRPAAESPAISQPAAQAPAGAPAGSGGQGAAVTPPEDGRPQAPVHVSISDRPAVVSQPGSSIPGGASGPPADVVRRPAAETPRTTTEIQARLQAAMRPSTPITAAAAPGRAQSTTDAVRVGVAGRRDYPASTRRDNASAPGRTDRPTVASATAAPKTGEKPTAATQGGGSHIAEQRADSDQPRPDAVSTESGGKEKPRRAAGKATKGDRTKPAKPAAAARSVPGARLSAYAEEAAELLAGLSPDRQRRKQDGTENREKEPGSTRTEPAED